MKLYLLRLRKSLAHGYDCFHGFVVAAADESSARANITRCADECRHNYRNPDDEPAVCVWHDPEQSECTLLGSAAPGIVDGIVMEDFNAG